MWKKKKIIHWEILGSQKSLKKSISLTVMGIRTWTLSWSSSHHISFDLGMKCDPVMLLWHAHDGRVETSERSDCKDSCHVTAVNWSDLKGSEIHQLLQTSPAERKAYFTPQLECWNAKLSCVTKGGVVLNKSLLWPSSTVKPNLYIQTGALHC